MPKRQILVVMSSADSLTLRDGRKVNTGYFLNELAIPLMRVMESGYHPVFANPKGNMPAMDPRSDHAVWFGGRRDLLLMSKRMLREIDSFRTPLRLDEVASSNLKVYSGIFVPGGHAPLEDLYCDPSLGRILEHFYDEGKPTGMLCHGPIALLSTLENPTEFAAALESGNPSRARELSRGWHYRGYRVTGLSDLEEDLIRLLARLRGRFGRMRFTVEQALRFAGAEYVKSLTETVVRDRELITGQGPLAANRFSRVFVDALREERVARIIQQAA